MLSDRRSAVLIVIRSPDKLTVSFRNQRLNWYVAFVCMMALLGPALHLRHGAPGGSSTNPQRDRAVACSGLERAWPGRERIGRKSPGRKCSPAGPHNAASLIQGLDRSKCGDREVGCDEIRVRYRTGLRPWSGMCRWLPSRPTLNGQVRGLAARLPLPSMASMGRGPG